MEKFLTGIYPLSMNYKDENFSIFVSENEQIKTRPKIQGIVYVNVSFQLSEIEYLDFIEFFNITLNNGLDNFLADFEIDNVFEIYSFYTKLNISYENGIENIYTINCILAKQNSYCDIDTLNVLEYIDVITNCLKGINSDFENNVSCDINTIQALNFIEKIKNNLKIINKK